MSVAGIVTDTRAALPCGCCIFVGMATETHKATTGAQPCSVDHVVVTERASALLIEALSTPRHRLLVETCRIVLSKAAREVGI